MHEHDTDSPPVTPPPQLLPLAPGKRGRPRKLDALSDAERARRYRAKKKARQAEELRLSTQAADAIAPSATPDKRCWAAVLAQVRAALLGFCLAAWRLRG